MMTNVKLRGICVGNLIFYLCCLGLLHATPGEQQPQKITGQVVWEAGDGPIRLDREVRVMRQSHLVIAPGVSLLFSSKAGIVVEGTLEIKGIKKKPVRMLPQRPHETWEGIQVLSSEVVQMKYTFIENAITGINASTANLVLDHVSIRNSRQGGIAVASRLISLELYACHLVRNRGNALHVLFGTSVAEAMINITDTVIKDSENGIVIHDLYDNGDHYPSLHRLNIIFTRVLVTNNMQKGISVTLGMHLYPNVSISTSHISHNSIGMLVATRAVNYTAYCCTFSSNKLEGLQLETLSLTSKWQDVLYLTSISHSVGQWTNIEGCAFEQHVRNLYIIGLDSTDVEYDSFVHIKRNYFSNSNRPLHANKKSNTIGISVQKPDIFSTIQITDNKFETLSLGAAFREARGNVMIAVLRNYFFHGGRAIVLEALRPGSIAVHINENKFVGNRGPGVVTVESHSSFHCVVINSNMFKEGVGSSVAIVAGSQAVEWIHAAVIANMFDSQMGTVDIEIDAHMCHIPLADDYSTSGSLLPELCQYIWPASSMSTTVDLSMNWWGSDVTRVIHSRVPNCTNRLEPVLTSRDVLGMADKDWEPRKCPSDMADMGDRLDQEDSNWVFPSPSTRTFKSNTASDSRKYLTIITYFWFLFIIMYCDIVQG